MQPAPSVILFSVLSGLGFGYLACLGLGLVTAHGWTAFCLWGIGYGFAVIGLLAATFHLGNPQRALLAFTQWRSSWLSREAWAAVTSLMVLAPVAAGAWLDFAMPRSLGIIGAALSIGTVGCTSMIYAQLRTVPRWNHWTVPATFLAFAITGGVIVAGQQTAAVILCIGLAALLIYGFATGDQRFAARASTLGTATGLGGIGVPTVFENPHTGGNYLLREMVFVVARKHAVKLRVIAVFAAAVLPAAGLLALPEGIFTTAFALLLHLFGAFAARWLFFAEAEHVVGLYYGAHQRT